MKKCANCGASCEDTARFCTNCGTPLPLMEGNPEAAQVGSEGQQQNTNQQDPNGYGWQQNAGRQDPYGSWQQNAGQQNAYGYGWQQNAGQQNTYGAYPPYGDYRNNGGTPYPVFGIRRRSIALAIIFTIITFGIYGIYWMIRINDEVNQLANEPEATSGGLVFLFSLITLGIYSFYWLYKMGERCDAIRGEWNGSRPILYLVLGLVGFSIISYALIQDVINKALPYQG